MVAFSTLNLAHEVACSLPLHYNSAVSGSVHRRFKRQAFPCSLAVTQESVVVSCPPLNDMLKFSGLSYVVEVAHKSFVVDLARWRFDGYVAHASGMFSIRPFR